MVVVDGVNGSFPVNSNINDRTASSYAFFKARSVSPGINYRYEYHFECPDVYLLMKVKPETFLHHCKMLSLMSQRIKINVSSLRL